MNGLTHYSMSRPLEAMTVTPRPKVAPGPLLAQPALPLAVAGSVSTTTHRATTTTTTTIKAGEFIVLFAFITST